MDGHVVVVVRTAAQACLEGEDATQWLEEARLPDAHRDSACETGDAISPEPGLRCWLRKAFARDAAAWLASVDRAAPPSHYPAQE